MPPTEQILSTHARAHTRNTHYQCTYANAFLSVLNTFLLEGRRKCQSTDTIPRADRGKRGIIIREPAAHIPMTHTHTKTCCCQINILKLNLATSKCSRAHTFTHMHTHTHTHASTHCIHTHTHTCTHASTHTVYTHTHANSMPPHTSLNQGNRSW